MTTLRVCAVTGLILGTLSLLHSSAQAGTDISTGLSGQVTAQADSHSATPASSADVAQSDPVITIHGLCPAKPTKANPPATSCSTVITRQAFEQLVDSMNISGKPLTPESRRNLAEVYVQYLALEPPATKAGIESTERFEAIMRWWHLRSLADLYRVELQEQFKNPSPDELHSYYMQHLTNYQRIKASRILIPHTPGSTEEAKRADEKALQAANLAQQRVANGEDPEVVQKDAYSALGTSSPPPTILGTLARSSFPATETDELFSLETGSVSKVETEGVSYVIYKIESKETLSEDSVKDEISRQIAQDKFRDAMRVINEAAKPEFNPSYFALPKSAPLVVEPNPRASPHP